MIHATKKLGLSLGDLSCLTTAQQFNLPVYIADRKWSDIAKEIRVKVIQIRN